LPAADCLTSTSGIPAAPANLLKLDISVQTCTLSSAAFKSAYDQSSGLGRGNARKARNRSGKVARDVTDGQWPMREQDLGEMVLSEHAARDGTRSLKGRW
jgi:hypothetical protein